MIEKAVTNLVTKIEYMTDHLATIATAISDLAKEQRIIRRKHNEMLDKLDIILLRLQ